MNALQLLKIGSNFLREKNVSSHLLDAEILLAKTLNISREEILVNLDQKINKKNSLFFQNYLQRRSRSEPIAYILGEKEFYSQKFDVNKHTLIPRPETELMVDELIKMYQGKSISILDIGSGSGCIIISLLYLKKSSGVGIDISKNAIVMAKKNSKKFELQNRLKFFNKSFVDIFNKKFDLIVSNPPYVVRKDIKKLSDDIKKFEPIIALDGGNDGLDLIKKVIYKSKDIIKYNGMLALEIGNEQIKKVSKILFDNSFIVKKVVKDYENNIRCVIAKYN